MCCKQLECIFFPPRIDKSANNVASSRTQHTPDKLNDSKTPYEVYVTWLSFFVIFFLLLSFKMNISIHKYPCIRRENETNTICYIPRKKNTRHYLCHTRGWSIWKNADIECISCCNMSNACKWCFMARAIAFFSNFSYLRRKCGLKNVKIPFCFRWLEFEWHSKAIRWHEMRAN